LGVVNRLPLLSGGEIERLLSQQTISEQHPWVTNDQQLIQAHLEGVWAAVMRATKSESRVEWGHYGSGYASFVDAWLYKTTPDFDAKHPVRDGEAHVGLVVLLSRLSPYFVFMQGEKRWHANGGSSYLPELGMLDQLEAGSVSLLARQVQPILESHGLVRALRDQLSEPLPAGLRVPTILTDGGFTQFDALFYWED
jgi:hypothetical protein